MLNRLEIFNELCILSCTLLLPIFTDMIDDYHLQYQTGYLLIGIFVLNSAVNTLYLVYEKFRAIYFILKFMVFKIKHKCKQGNKNKV